MTARYEKVSAHDTNPRDPISVCPKCAVLVKDLDGFGVLIHDDCGYCSHPCSTGGYCDHCFMRTAA